MEVGAVEYQLCPLNLNCEQCDFYAEMSQGCHRPADSGNNQKYITFQKPKPETITFQAGYQYLPGHFWFKHIAKNRIIVGMDDILWNLVCPPQAIILSDPGTQIQKGNCFAWIVIPHGIVYMKMPFSGHVLHHNHFITRKETLLSELRYTAVEDKWFLALEVDENELQSVDLLTKQEYSDCVRHDCDRIYQTVSASYARHTPLKLGSNSFPEPEAERLVLGKADFTELLKKTTANLATIR